jgi:lipopolysaccharide export system protein LptA
VKATIYQSEAASVQVTADHGSANEKEGRMHMSGNVRAVADDGSASLSCDTIAWQRRTRELKATGRVTGRLADLSFRQAREVRAVLAPKDGDVKGTSLVLTSVFVLGQGITFRSPEAELDADRLTARYEENRTRLVWEGEGKPFRANWKAQNLSVTGAKFTITQDVKQVGGREVLSLRSGAFTGNVAASWSPEGDTVSLTGLSEWRVELSADGKSWSSTGAGSPFVFRSRANQLTARGRTIKSEGAVVQTGGASMMEVGRIELASADVELETQDGKATLTNLSSFVFTQARGAWTGDAKGAPLTINWPARQFRLTAPAARIEGRVLSQGTQRYEWTKLALSGGVNASLVVRNGTQEQQLNASAPQASLDREAKSLSLSGGVTLRGNVTILGSGETVVTSPSITVVFNDDLTQVVSIRMTGN